MEGQEEGRRRPRGWSLSQAVNAVGQATLKVSSAIAHTAASAGELLTDKDLRKKGGTKILEKASEGANVVRRSFRTGAQTLARGRREVVERAAAVVRRVGEEMTARRLARALQEERSHGVDVQLGFQVFEEAPHDLRSRLWLVLLESPELARPFQPLRAPPSSAASPGNSEPEGESEGRDAAGSSTALEELLGGRHGEMAAAPAAAHDEAGAAADEEERRQHAAPEAAALEAVPTSALRPAEAGEQDTPAGGEEGGSSGIPDIDEVGAAEAELPGVEAGAVAEQEERGGRAQTGASAGADAEDATAGLQGKGAGLLALEAAGAGGEGDESAGRKALQRPEEEEEAGEQDLVFKPFPAESGAACVSQAAAGGGLPQEGEVWQQAQLRGAEEEQEEEEEDWMVLPDLDEMALVMHRSRRSRGGCSQQASGAGEPRAAASADGASPLPEDAMRSRLRPRVAARRGGGGGGGGGLQGRDGVLELRRAMQDMQTAIFSVPLPIPASYRPDSHFGTLLQMTVGQEDVDDIITRDIHRTFPEHPQFGTDSGRQALFDVLKAYSMQDLEVGYCQGMAFLAGIILMWLPPEPAFRLFSRLLSEPGPDLRRIYLPGLSALKLELAKFEWLLSRHLPRLFAHLQAHAVPSVLYASQWFLTAFCCPFPSSFAARIIDIMLFENSDHIIMQTAVAVMAGLEFELLHMDDFEEVISHIKLEPVRWSLLRQRQIIDAALESPITADELEAADRLISLQQAESALEKGGEAANKRWRQERAERGSSNADGMACESGQPLSSHADEGPGASGEGTGRAFADATGGDEVEQDLWRDMAEMDEEYLAMVRAIGIIWGDGLDPEPEPGQSELEAPDAPDSLQPGERL